MILFNKEENSLKIICKENKLFSNRERKNRNY